MDLVVEGRHALLFDDDATSAFVNSREALVPWNSDRSLLIDRYDVRHLLDRIPPRPTAGARRQRLLDDSCDAAALAEIDCERYQDLPPSDEAGEEVDSETRVTSDATGYGAYQAVPFSYGDKNLDSHNKTEYSSDFRPPFEVPEFLLSHLPPTEKLHQIMARTALFVNEHGRQSEIVLRVKQGDNPTFGFLMPDHHLHAYFQYLIDHPQVLKHYTDSPKKEEEKPDPNYSEAGALSLLGSVYGTGDDDDATLKKEIKEAEPFNMSVVGNTTIPVQSELGESSSVVIGNKDATKLPFSAGAKEKMTLTAKKTFSGNATSVAASRKAGDGEQSLTAEKGQGSQQKGEFDLNPSILEPPSFLKRTIEKIVEFIVRNGKQFEAILINQDKNIGRFPFLLPTNQYHSCYLKTLEEAYELKLQGKSLFDQKSDEDHHGRSKKKVESHVKNTGMNDLSLDELSEGGYFDPRKDKFKMTLFGQKKDSQDQQPSKAAKQHGLSADEAAAIVLAATRGASPANTFHKKSTDEGAHLPKASGATTEEAAASVMAATRGSGPSIAPQSMPREDGRTSSFSSLQGSKLISRFTSDISGKSMSTGLSASAAAKSDKRNSHGAANDVTVATVIAKSVALAASSEADSSEAGLTKEQKLKAERLKRAKMFASLIKSGSNCVGESVTSASNRNSSMEPPTVESMQNGTDSETLGLEREGSSAPFATEVSDREHDSRKKRYSHHPDDSDEDLNRNRKKRHTSHHKKTRSSSSQDKEARHRHKHHSTSSDEDREHDEQRRRKSSEHRRRRHRAHHHSSEDEDSELYVKRRRKHHSHSERKRESETGDAKNSVEASKGPSVSSPGEHPSDSTEIPSDLRAKIRAMLLETL